ncbi:unnamed protein product [Rotaria magnacalcarata]|uniref:Protein kinase domain-containing protein n=1 Tax=Rotaria magnacalcarata TaxID=392030 RepID=A0A816KNM3_9BILA|nr:unnamed protein product [Rotaria magnacalcarata]CAF3826856.1 unnamed protein product [Rotaria magnacalcarata]
MMDGNDNNQPATRIIPQSEFELQYLLGCKRIHEEQETERKRIHEEQETERKRIHEEQETIRENKKIEEEQETERKRIHEEQETIRENKKIEEEQETERMKIKHTQSSISNDILWSSHQDFYDNKVDGNLYGFEIDWISSNDNDYFNDAIKSYIKDYLNQLSSPKRVFEANLQKHFNYLIANLLNAFDDSTVLQYKDTVGSSYLESKYSPDCTFIFKNINVGINCLQDFAVCLGELKCSNKDNTERRFIGQLLQYLSVLLKKQARPKIYGFLLNNEYIKFYYVERRPNSSDYNYYQSKPLPIYDYSSKKLPINNRQKITTNEESKKHFHYCEDTWKIFTKFLIMNMDFYRYETLNIDPCDNQLNKYLITKRLGYGLTSKIYLLNNQENNNEKQPANNNNKRKQTINNNKRKQTININKRKQENNTNDIESHVIKISKENGYSSEFLNELKITEKLKEKDIDKFKLFFQEIIYSSPTGNYLIFKNELEKLESLSLIQSKKFIDIIEYLYDSNIIHRDIRPNNLMIDRSGQHIKLIDFGFGFTLDINDKSKELPIAGTITYAGYEFLNFCSKTEHSTLWSRSYRYDKKFDLKCALNIIICMINKTVRGALYSIEGLSSTKEKIPKLLELWANVKNKNKNYSNFLNIINKLTESSDFQILKDQLEELYNKKIQ